MRFPYRFRVIGCVNPGTKSQSPLHSGIVLPEAFTPYELILLIIMVIFQKLFQKLEKNIPFRPSGQCWFCILSPG
jgi:hypothetical protein